MFTGLIEDIGTLLRIENHGDSAVLTVGTSIPVEQLELGESIAVNGVCLTVVSTEQRSFTVDVSHETMSRTAFSRLQQGHDVHLERAVRPVDRLGGHIVQGHVDGVGEISTVETHKNSWDIHIKMPGDLHKEVIEKGSIAIDGVSLTVNELTRQGLRLTIIPFTDAKTTLTSLRTGDPVNIETDIIGKYIRHFMQQDDEHGSQSSLTDTLMRLGYINGDND